MQMPHNLTAPRPKLLDGEAILHSVEGLRKRGIFGNRYGALHVTEQRVIFVKAIVKGLVGAALTTKGVKPMLSFERRSLQRAEKIPAKKLHLLELSEGQSTERFMLAEADIDAVLGVLGQAV